MQKPPNLTVGVQQQTGLYDLAGFEEFDRWMRMNDAHYKVISDQAGTLGMSDTDRLRMLVSAMTVKAYGYEEKLHEMIRTAGAYPFRPPQP
jgi:hypothetical protein